MSDAERKIQLPVQFLAGAVHEILFVKVGVYYKGSQNGRMKFGNAVGDRVDAAHDGSERGLFLVYIGIE